MHTFFAPDIQQGSYELSGTEAQHALKVLRLQEGDRLYLLDGKGGRYTGKIRLKHAKSCEIEILESAHTAPPTVLTEIAVAPPKTASRLEFMLEKLTELGVWRISLFESEFSERRKVNAARLQKILTAGLKQSHNVFLPDLRTFPTFEEIISEDFDGQRLIAHCYDAPKTNIQNVLKTGQNTQILIGPEGDFSRSEIQQAVSKGFTEISLTEQRLRTETAAIYAAVSLNLFT